MNRRMNREKPTGRALLRALLFAPALLALAACEEEPAPVAVDIAPYVGVWELGRFGESDPYVYLQISDDSHISYARDDTTGMGSNCLAVDRTPLGVVSETRIVVPLFLGLTVDFEINQAPGEAGGATRMTIDGDRLTRTDSRNGGFDYEWTCDDGLGRWSVG